MVPCQVKDKVCDTFSDLRALGHWHFKAYKFHPINRDMHPI